MSKPYKSNLNIKERKTLEKLKNNSNLIIKSADKGAAIVIMDSKYYEEKILEIILDEKTYSEIDEKLDGKILNKIKKLTSDSRNKPSDKEIAYLTNFECKTSQFYGLPKIHKSKEIADAIIQQKSELISVPNPKDLKFRPIVAGPCNLTHRLTE